MDTLIVSLLTLQIQAANLALQSLPISSIAYAQEIEPMAESLPDGSVDLETYARSVAEAHGLNVKRFLGTISCESHWQTDVQSNYILKNGSRENSWGIVQINLSDPPTGRGTVTLEQAKDPYWSIRYMAERFDEGLASRWTCWRNL